MLCSEIESALKDITPGEWQSGRDGNLRVYGADGGEAAGLIANVFKGRANVELIAAAPRLLRQALASLRHSQQAQEQIAQERDALESK